MDIDTLLRSHESHCLEYKQQCPAPDVMAEIFCSFANSSGGDLIIGVEDGTREVLGIEDRDIIAVEEMAANVAATQIEPIMVSVTKSVRCQGKNLILIHVEAGYQKPYFAKKGQRKKCFVRIGSTTREADPATIELLRLESRGVSWDTLPCTGLTLQQLNRGLIHDYLDLRCQARGISRPKAIDQNWLIKSRFAAKAGGSLCPTNAAALLFSDEASAIFPSSTIECARFRGTEPRDFIDKKSIAGPLLHIPERAIAFVQNILPISASRTGVARNEIPAYPVIALREFTMNAICHRIYAHPSSSTKIAIFDDVIEITNSGGLHQGLEIADLGTGVSLLRNTTIARVFNEVGWIEGWGTGIQEAQRALAQSRLPPATFRERGAFFQVASCWRWPADITPRELEILQLVAQKERIESKDLASLFGISERGARKILTQLCSKNLLQKIGTTRAAAYRLAV